MNQDGKILSLEEEWKIRIPPEEWRIPPPEILEIEGCYYLKELKVMCQQHGLNPVGDKELLIRRLLQAGVLEKGILWKRTNH